MNTILDDYVVRIRMSEAAYIEKRIKMILKPPPVWMYPKLYDWLISRVFIRTEG